MRLVIAKSARRGFTLLELMVAVAILAFTLSALLATFISCMLLNQSNNNLVVAANDAQHVLEQIKGLSYGNISNYYIPSDYFDNLPNETVNVTKPYDQFIRNITVNITWDERQNHKNFSLTTRIAK